MAKSFDLNGSGEPIPQGSGFDTPNANIGDDGSADSGGNDEFGSTTLDGGIADPRGGDFVFDAERHISKDKLNADGTYRRKRKRRGSGGVRPSNQRTSKADLSASIEGLTKVLLVMHIGMAEMTKTPELVLTETEANTLATSTANVMDQFDITPDPKIQAVVGLLMTAGMIYGPRLYNIRERVKNEGKKLATVHTLRSVDNNSQMVDPQSVM